MCIRRVLFCPACLRYGKLLKHTVPAEPGAIIRVIYEIPCGFSTCEWFNPVLSFIDLPILTAELQQPCSISCKWSLCQIMPIVEVCCDGKRSWHFYRLKQAEFHSPEAQVKRFLSTEFPPLRNPDLPISEHNSADLFPIEIPIAKITHEELLSHLYQKVTYAECKEIGQGKTVIVEHRDFLIELSGGRQQVNFTAVVTDHRFFGNEKAAAKFECSFGLLLHRVFWREERSRQKIDLEKFFAVSTGEK